MTSRVLLVGDGVLVTQVERLLKSQKGLSILRCAALEDASTGLLHLADLAVVLADGWPPRIHQEAEVVFHAAKVPWLRAYSAFGEAVIGPLVIPGESGCSQCADVRRFMTMDDRNEIWEIKSQLMLENAGALDVYASLSGLANVAHIIVFEIHRAIHEDSRKQERNSIVTVNLKTLTSSRHKFLPDPRCPVCGSLPEDTADAANISLAPAYKLNPKSFRTQSIEKLQSVLAADYLDSQTGLLNAKVQDLIAPYAAVSVNLPLTVGDEGASGRAYTYPESELTAILEGLERYCGIEPRGKQGVVYDTYAHLKDVALYPPQVGLHDDAQYDDPKFPFLRFDEDIPMEWVWGHSFKMQRPVLVPKLLAYYSLGYKTGFVYETSNGCAVGGSLVEAVLHGILEVVERDAFLMTWYAQLPLPKISLNSIEDEEIQLMIQRLRYGAGYELHLFNATMENGIPSVFAIAKNLRDSGMNLMCAAGSHIDAHRAIKSAIHENAGMLLRFDKKLEHHRAQYVQMYRDSSRVQEMDHHSMLYGLPEAEERLAFLLAGEQPLQSFREAFHWPHQRHDLTEDLNDLLGVFQRLNMDVIVVNQTAPELKRNNLHCVKVIIPGMLPMTFGHHLRRINGLDRVQQVPAALGYAKQPLSLSDLNPYPHPFP